MKRLLAFFVLASPLFGQDPTSSVYYDNVVVVVDGSGSMNENWTGTGNCKMDIAKQALKTVLLQIEPTTQVGILVFNGSDSNWIYELGPRDDQRLSEAIGSIRTGGGTPLGTNIKRGADALIKQRRNQFNYGSYRLLIVTDGQATGFGEERKMNDYTSEIIARGINVNVIGVDMGEKHDLAQIVGDNYHAANDPDSLEKTITEVFAEVNKPTNEDGTSDFELLEGLDPALAKDMIKALTKPRNQPIGEAPEEDRPKRISSSSSIDDEPKDAEGSSKTGFIIVGSVLLIIVGIIAAKSGSHHY